MSFSWKYWDGDGVEKDWVDADALPNGADLFNVQFLNQFITQINKRLIAINYDTLLSEVVDGDTACQNYVCAVHNISWYKVPSLLIGRFCREKTVAEAIAGGVLPLIASGLASLFPGHWTALGHRATRIHPTDPYFSAWEYRYYGSNPTSGDIYGPWIFEDLRMLIDQCTLLRLQCASEHNVTARIKSASDNAATSSAAGYAAAVAKWPSEWKYSVVSFNRAHSFAYQSYVEVLGKYITTLLESQCPFGITMHSSFWDYFTAPVQWSMVGAVTATGLDYEFDAQGTVLLYQAYAITKTGTLEIGVTSISEYPLEIYPNPPPHYSVEHMIGYDLLTNAGGYGTFVLIDIGGDL